MQMQWGVITGDYKIFNQTKLDLKGFVKKNMIYDSQSEIWLKKLESLSLPDQDNKIKELVLNLNELLDRSSPNQIKSNDKNKLVGDNA